MAVVVGYAATPEGKAALRYAVDEARLRGTSLLVVSSALTRNGGEAATPEATTVDLRDVEDLLRASGLEHEVRSPAPASEPAEDLLAAAHEVGADCIVIGLRRRTPVGKLILGSNAQRILLDAPCPVLAVKAER